MRLVSTVMMGASLLICIGVGWRILRASRHTDRVPGLLVSLILLGLGLGYFLSAGAIRMRVGVPALGEPGMARGVGLLNVGGTAAAFLSYLLFRRDLPAARVLAWVLSVALWGVWLANLLTGGFAISDRFIWSNYALASLRVAALVWCAGESLHYWQLMRRRLRIGLADPVLTNRFLLWGIGVGSASCAIMVTIFGMAASRDGAIPATTEIYMCALGLVEALCFLVAFSPPAFYRRFLERRAPEMIGADD